MTSTIDVRGLTRTFGRTTVLDDVTFSVPEGAIVGLLGRNGAGKTTIMSIVAGQDRPTAGEVRVGGHRPFEHAPTLAAVRYVRDNQRYPDDYRLHHVLRIAPTFSPGWSQELATELVERFALPARTPVKKYSRGQLSSLGIVIALASRAPVTLLDEPYLGLDVTARGVFYEVLVRECSEFPRTVLLSTHLVQESEPLFDEVVILDRGRIVAAGSSDELRRSAVVLGGTTDAVRRVIEGRRVLHRDTVGGLMSATVRGHLDRGLADSARAHGVQAHSATLQQLVEAYGAPETSHATPEGAAA